MRPTDVNGINKVAGEYYHLVYNNVFGVRACSLRLTNVYGPRQLIRHNRQGFIGWFIRLAVEDREIQIFGDGSQLRDFVYVDDAADAFLRAGASDACNGEVFNVGGQQPVSHRDLVALLLEVAGTGRARYVEWPAEKKVIDIGSFYADSSKLSAAVGWRPQVELIGRPRANRQLLPPAPLSLPRGRASAGAGPVSDPVVRFMNLKPAEDAPAVESAIRRVVDRGWYVLGPELERFETEFAAAAGAPHAIGVGTGTDAIAIALRALEIGPGDEVITSPLSAAYTALAIMMVGARPVFADLDPERLTMSPAAVEAAVTPRTAALLPVHLYGQAADMPALAAIAARHHLLIVEDCCQAHLATCAGRPVGSFGEAAAYSFYPTKNLGALGDGGAITAGDATLAARMRRIRNGGQTDRYHHVEIGVNSRLDELQAAILSARLPFLRGWIEARRAKASRYRRLLEGAAIMVPPERDPGHVYHLFPVLSPNREGVQATLRAQGIETLIHYPLPIPRQKAMESVEPGACPEADRVCAQVFSLPLYPGMPDDHVDRVAEALGRAVGPSG